jgi:hypothetical protein
LGRDADNKAIMACPPHVSLDTGLLKQFGLVRGWAGVMEAGMSPAAKMIIIFILLWLGVHLLLYGYVKRRIAAAKRNKDAEA